MNKQLEKQLNEAFDKVIEDSEKIRQLLDNPDITIDQLNVIKTKISNNKTINGACNGKISVVRMLSVIENE